MTSTIILYGFNQIQILTRFIPEYHFKSWLLLLQESITKSVRSNTKTRRFIPLVAASLAVDVCSMLPCVEMAREGGKALKHGAEDLYHKAFGRSGYTDENQEGIMQDNKQLEALLQLARGEQQNLPEGTVLDDKQLEALLQLLSGIQQNLPERKVPTAKQLEAWLKLLGDEEHYPEKGEMLAKVIKALQGQQTEEEKKAI